MLHIITTNCQSVLSAFSVCVFWVLLKATNTICLLAFVMVLYCILPLKAFILLIPAEVGFMHMCNTLYLHCLSKEPNWSISRRRWMFRSQRKPNQKWKVHLLFSCSGIICPLLSLTFILNLHSSVLWSLKMPLIPLSRFPQGNDSGLHWPICWGRATVASTLLSNWLWAFVHPLREPCIKIKLRVR